MSRMMLGLVLGVWGAGVAGWGREVCGARAMRRGHMLRLLEVMLGVCGGGEGPGVHDEPMLLQLLLGGRLCVGGVEGEGL